MVSRSTGPLRTILSAVAVGLVALLVGCSAGQVTQTASIRPAVNGNQADVGEIALRDVMIAYPETGGYRAGDEAPLVLSIVNRGSSDDELVSVSSPAAEDVQLVGNGNLPGGTALKVIAPEGPVGETSSATPSGTSENTSGSAVPTESSVPEDSITDPQPPADTATGTTSSEESAPAQTESSDSTATETATSLAPEEIGTISIVLTGLVQDLPMGRNVPVTFVFAEAGSVTFQLPIASPETARQDPPENEGEGEH